MKAMIVTREYPRESVIVRLHEIDYFIPYSRSLKKTAGFEGGSTEIHMNDHSVVSTLESFADIQELMDNARFLN